MELYGPGVCKGKNNFGSVIRPYWYWNFGGALEECMALCMDLETCVAMDFTISNARCSIYSNMEIDDVEVMEFDGSRESLDCADDCVFPTSSSGGDDGECYTKADILPTLSPTKSPTKSPTRSNSK